MDNLVAEAGQSLEFERLEPQRMTAVLKLMEGSDVFVALPWEGREASVCAVLRNRGKGLASHSREQTPLCLWYGNTSKSGWLDRPI